MKEYNLFLPGKDKFETCTLSCFMWDWVAYKKKFNFFSNMFSWNKSFQFQIGTFQYNFVVSRKIIIYLLLYIIISDNSLVIGNAEHGHQSAL